MLIRICLVSVIQPNVHRMELTGDSMRKNKAQKLEKIGN